MASPRLVAALTLLIGALVAALSGVRMGGDSVRYLLAWDVILSGSWPGKSASYPGYVVTVAVLRVFGPWAVVAVQIAAAGLASLALFDLATRLYDRRAGLIAGVLFAINLKIASWHAYILTDSLYISSLVLTVWAVERARVEGTVGRYLAAATLTLYTASLRPTGWLVVVIVVGYLVWHLPMRRKARALAAGAAVASAIAVVAVMPAVGGAVDAESPTRMLYEGRVQWAPPEARMTMPGPNDETDVSLGAGLAYVLDYPSSTAELAVRRVIRSLISIRPYFSAVHNLAIVLYLLPVYLMALVGLRLALLRSLGLLMASVFAVHMIVVAGTFADYDGRFLLHVLPIVLAMAGVGASRSWDWIGGTRTSSYLGSVLGRRTI